MEYTFKQLVVAVGLAQRETQKAVTRTHRRVYTQKQHVSFIRDGIILPDYHNCLSMRLGSSQKPLYMIISQSSDQAVNDPHKVTVRLSDHTFKVGQKSQQISSNVNQIARYIAQNWPQLSKESVLSATETAELIKSA